MRVCDILANWSAICRAQILNLILKFLAPLAAHNLILPESERLLVARSLARQPLVAGRECTRASERASERLWWPANWNWEHYRRRRLEIRPRGRATTSAPRSGPGRDWALEGAAGWQPNGRPAGQVIERLPPLLFVQLNKQNRSQSRLLSASERASERELSARVMCALQNVTFRGREKASCARAALFCSALLLCSACVRDGPTHTHTALFG